MARALWQADTPGRRRGPTGHANRHRSSKPAPNEAAEQGNVIVGDVPIGDSARPAVAKVSRCHQIISKGLEMRAVRCSRISPPPQLRQIKPEKKVLQVSGSSAKIGNINVPSINKAQVLRQYRATEMTGR